MATIVQVFVGIIALFFGSAVTMALMGFGICGSELTIGATVAGMVAAIVISLVGFVATPSMRALGASLFCLPLGLAIIFMVLEREWLRSMSILVCIIAAGLTIWVAKAQTPKKQEGP